MSNPLVHAFFVGRALSEALSEQAEKSLTNVLSDAGKLNAELREQLRQFTEEVIERANRAEDAAMSGRDSSTANPVIRVDSEAADLQALIDELRAEIAHLRSELKHYRSNRIS